MIFARSLALAAFLAPLASAAQPPPAEQPRFTVALDDWRISYRDGPGKVGLGISITLQGKGTFAIPSSGEGQLTPGHAGFHRKPHIRPAHRPPGDGACRQKSRRNPERGPSQRGHQATLGKYPPMA